MDGKKVILRYSISQVADCIFEPSGLCHPTLATDHPSDEDLSLGTLASRKDGARKMVYKQAVRELVLLCYKRRTPQKGHRQSLRSSERARMMRRVAMEWGLCRCGRTRAPGPEVLWKFGG